MRYFIPLICFLLASVGTSAQKDTIYLDKDSQPSDRDHYVYYRFIEQKQGLYFVKDYFRNHVLQFTGSYTDSALEKGNGYFTDYDSLGNKISEGNIINGKREGFWIAYNRLCEDQYVDDSVFYVGDKANGLSIKRNHLTHKMVACGYLSDENLTGRWAVLHPSGDTAMIKYYQNDLENGYHIEFDDTTHKVLAVGYMHNGLMVGTWNLFLNSPGRSDTSFIQIHYDSVNKASCLIEFDSVTHKRRRMFQLLYGKADGLWIEYSDDTELVSEEVTYKGGERNGPFKTYIYHTNKLESTGQYKDGERNGHIIFYNEKGQIESDNVYNMGTKTDWKNYMYNDDGTLEKTDESLPNPTRKETIFKNGKPASVDLYRDDVLIRHTDLGKPKKK